MERPSNKCVVMRLVLVPKCILRITNKINVLDAHDLHSLTSLVISVYLTGVRGY